MLLVAPVMSAVFSCNLIFWTVQSIPVLTKKGQATRTRIVGAAADLHVLDADNAINLAYRPGMPATYQTYLAGKKVHG